MLLRKLEELSCFYSIGWLNSSNSSEWVAASAGSLVLNSWYDCPISPVNACCILKVNWYDTSWVVSLHQTNSLIFNWTNFIRTVIDDTACRICLILTHTFLTGNILFIVDRTQNSNFFVNAFTSVNFAACAVFSTRKTCLICLIKILACWTNLFGSACFLRSIIKSSRFATTNTATLNCKRFDASSAAAC